MKRIGILYFSAVGGTKVVAELLAELLIRGAENSGGEADDRRTVSVMSIEDQDARTLASEAGFLVFCYPTYYLKPAPPMRTFAAGLGIFESAKPCYIVTTCELYSENSVRRLARILVTRGLEVSGWKALRAPGSDITAVLDARLVPWLYRFGQGFEAGLRTAAEEIATATAEGTRPPARLPPPRWYTPLTQLLQVTALNHFDAVKYRLKACDERCTRCGLCAVDCPAGAINMGERGVRIEAGQCILCCRCVHRCPERAIVLIERLKDNRRIDAALLAGLKAKARATLGLGKEPASLKSTDGRNET
jgi:ferredoxin